MEHPHRCDDADLVVDYSPPNIHNVRDSGQFADIAEKLTISEETVKRHLTIIFDKTGMSSRLELAMYAVKHGIGT